MHVSDRKDLFCAAEQLELALKPFLRRIDAVVYLPVYSKIMLQV
jgi:hypothetical protein